MRGAAGGSGDPAAVSRNALVSPGHNCKGSSLSGVSLMVQSLQKFKVAHYHETLLHFFETARGS